jgi:hypothetical protein
VIAGFVLVNPATEAGAEAPPPTGAPVQFVSHLNGKCLTVEDSSAADNATIVQRPCSSAAIQQWRLVAVKQGAKTAYQAVNGASGKCLRAPAQNGAAFTQLACAAPAAADQLFALPEAAGQVRIKPQNAAPQRCLEIPAGTSADSAPLVQNTCAAASRQRWIPRSADQLLTNPGFEDSASGWQFSTGSGTATNIPRSGARLAYLDATADASIKQQRTVTESGTYQLSAWVATSGTNGRISARRGGTEIGSVPLPKETKYGRYVLGGLTLTRGDTLEVTVHSATDGWVNVDDVALQRDQSELRIASSNAKLLQLFSWSVANARTWVHPDGKTGPINNASGRYKASVWAGYDSRPAYYSRDVAHQVVGAHLLGLGQENKNMLRSFAASATPRRAYYPLWAFAFDTTTPYSMDYRDDDHFVREVPAVFELVERGDTAYRWTGDRDYVSDNTLWTYYLGAVSAFVDGHNARIDNGQVKVAEGVGTDIFKGVASYNEQGNEALIEAGDGIASQYRAYLALADLAAARGDATTSTTYRARAKQLRTYFNDVWSRKAGTQELVRGYNISHGKPNPLTGWGKENSLFMPMKQIVDPGPRLDAYLDMIDAKDSDPATRSRNIEAFTYLPDTFFPYNRNATAWKWMQYVFDNRIQYPELSFTLVGQVVQGLLGVEPDAAGHRVATQSHLPPDIGWLRADNVPVGANKIAVRHDGSSMSTLTNSEGAANISWEARFVGKHPRLVVNGVAVAATTIVVNGVTVSRVRVTVAPGTAATVRTA